MANAQPPPRNTPKTTVILVGAIVLGVITLLAAERKSLKTETGAPPGSGFETAEFVDGPSLTTIPSN
jgi:hypothetical protein